MTESYARELNKLRTYAPRPEQLKAVSSLVDLHMTWEYREDMFWSWWFDG